jgi:hypothetical protein
MLQILAIPLFSVATSVLTIPIVEFSPFGVSNSTSFVYPENQYYQAQVQLNPNGTYKVLSMDNLYCGFSPKNPICP